MNNLNLGLINAINCCSEQNSKALLNYCLNVYHTKPEDLQDKELEEMYIFSCNVMLNDKKLGLSR